MCPLTWQTLLPACYAHTNTELIGHEVWSLLEQQLLLTTPFLNTPYSVTSDTSQQLPGTKQTLPTRQHIATLVGTYVCVCVYGDTLILAISDGQDCSPTYIITVDGKHDLGQIAEEFDK